MQPEPIISDVRFWVSATKRDNDATLTGRGHQVTSFRQCTAHLQVPVDVRYILHRRVNNCECCMTCFVCIDSTSLGNRPPATVQQLPASLNCHRFSFPVFPSNFCFVFFPDFS